VQAARSESCRFLRIDELVDDQGELALTIDYDLENHTTLLEACAILPDNTSQGEIAAAYVSLCDLDSACFDSLFLADSTHSQSMPTLSEHDSKARCALHISFSM
jgi:hypothetical protein